MKLINISNSQLSTLPFDYVFKQKFITKLFLFIALIAVIYICYPVSHSLYNRFISLNEISLKAIFVLIIISIIQVSFAYNVIKQITLTSKFEINTNYIKFSEHSIVHTKKWEELITNYAGILFEEEFHSGNDREAGYSLYRLTLKHHENQKNIIWR